MGDEEIENILYQIQELVNLLGWTSAGVQTSDGALIGMYVGEHNWILGKVGSNAQKPTH